MASRKPAQRRVEIPEHLSHGSSYVYRWYRCRCGPCQSWRRDYDQRRDEISRRGHRAPDRRKGRQTRAPWYICAWQGQRYQSHNYLDGQCLRCDAKQAVEEFWEQRWRDGSGPYTARLDSRDDPQARGRG